MELMPKAELENLDVIWYVKVLENDQSLCNICLTDEIEDGKQWTRYQLKCGHVFHSRCLRRWCGTKQAIHCSFCGYVGCQEHKWCRACEAWGHMPMEVEDCVNNQDIFNSMVHSKSPKPSKTSRKAPSKR